jgi:uncharacterized protein (TIGR02266 family)
VARKVEAAAPAGAERRTSARAELEIEVGLETDHNFYTGLTQDISTGGVFVATHELRNRGEHVVLKFTLPGVATPFQVEGEVRWIREVTGFSRSHENPTGMGIKFLNLSPQAKMLIASFLNQRDSIFYDDE